VVILSAIALWLFQYVNQKRKIRQEEMHERKRQQFEELLKLVSDKNPADAGQTVQGSDPAFAGLPGQAQRKLNGIENAGTVKIIYFLVKKTFPSG
jgi:hypothetical protein